MGKSLGSMKEMRRHMLVVSREAEESEVLLVAMGSGFMIVGGDSSVRNESCDEDGGELLHELNEE